jgi:hypothetical protein
VEGVGDSAWDRAGVGIAAIVESMPGAIIDAGEAASLLGVRACRSAVDRL